MGSLKWLTVFFFLSHLKLPSFVVAGAIQNGDPKLVPKDGWLGLFQLKQPFRDGYQWLQLGPRFVH